MLVPLVIPELVRQRAMSNGAVGRRWLDDLPELVAGLADRWGLEVGKSFRGGTAAFVTAATDQSGRACVLKVAMPAEMDVDGVVVGQWPGAVARGWSTVRGHYAQCAHDVCEVDRERDGVAQAVHRRAVAWDPSVYRPPIGVTGVGLTDRDRLRNCAREVWRETRQPFRFVIGLRRGPVDAGKP